MIPNLLKYPKNGILYPSAGLNKADNRQQVGASQAVDLRNWLYSGKTLLKRGAFRAYSTIDYATPGRFRGAHDYQAPGAAARLLYYLNDGTIREYLTSSTEATRQSSLATGIEGDFATVYDAAVFANGSDAPRIGRGTTWRNFGSPAAVSTLAVGTTAGATIAAGTYLHVVVPVIDVGGVAVVFGDWSNIVRTVLGGAIGQFDLTWTDIVDSRITRYLIFRTEAGATDLRSVGAVNAGVGAFTDNFADSALPVTVSGGVSRPSPQYSWGVPLRGRIVAFVGNRVVFGNFPTDSLQNAVQVSRKAGNSYEAEGFPADLSTLVRMPGDGEVTALVGVSTSDPGGRANDLFIGQPNACYILPETNPDYPLTMLSTSLGPVNKKAWAMDRNWLFFQSRRGVEFWPGSGRDIYLISDQIQPVFDGGGPQQVSGNVSSADITYRVHKGRLWITVRDDGAATGPNKAYVLDLIQFRKGFNPAVPSASARFTGPMVNDEPASTHLGFGILLERLDGTLLDFDNQNNRILQYDESSGEDEIDGVEYDIIPRLEVTGILREDMTPQKILCHGKLYLLSNSPVTIEVRAEYDRIISQAATEANATSFEWDFEWDDIDWTYQNWYYDVSFDFAECVGKWFTLVLMGTGSESGEAYGGMEIFFDAMKQYGVFR